MKRSVFVLAAVLSIAACSAKHDSVEGGGAPAGPLRSAVRAGDPSAQAQFVSGFYGIENGWRWTSGKFTVLLKTPPGASQNGGVVSLDLTIPDGAMQKLNAITLSAAINGSQLKSVTYDKPGNYTFSADVPASMLTSDSVKVDFTTDKTFTANPDVRNLAVIAAGVGIASK